MSGKKARKPCKKGWRKVTWTKAGPKGAPGTNGGNGSPGRSGATGPTGPVRYVRDRNGAILGQYMGLLPAGASFFEVLVNGGLYIYIGNGRLYPQGLTPSYETNTCAGTPYMMTGTPQAAALFTGMAGSPTRFVVRATAPGFGPASAFQLTTTTTPIAAVPLYRRDATGACVLVGPGTGVLVTLTQVPAPPDVEGPLTVD